MNEFASYFNDDKMLDLVLMNDKLCFHETIFEGSILKKSFCMPNFIFRPPTDEFEMEVSIECPICRKNYPEATERIKKQIEEFYERQNE